MIKVEDIIDDPETYLGESDGWQTRWPYDAVKAIAVKYARAVIDEMVMRGDNVDNGLIYSDGEWDVNSERYDALYNYDRIDEFKKGLE